MEEALHRHWQMILATLVLTGVLTEAEMAELGKTNAPIPDTWQGIVAQVGRIKTGGEP